MKVLRNIALIIAGAILLFLVSFLISGTALVRGKNLRVPFDGDTSRSGIIDDRNIIEPDEEERLNKLIKERSAKLEMNIVIFVSGTKLYDYETKNFTANTYDKLMGKEFTDGMLYYMDFSGKRPAYDYLWVSGSAAIIFPHNISEVTDKIIPYLPPSSKQNISQYDVIPGIEHFLDVISSYVENYSTNYLRYEEDKENKIYFFDTGKEFYVSKRPGPRLSLNLFGAFMVGYITMLIIYFVTKHRYKFKDKTDARIYVANGKTVFTERSDVFIREHTTRVKIESSSGGHSGGGHHGGGGGGHSGGGRGGGSHR